MPFITENTRGHQVSSMIGIFFIYCLFKTNISKLKTENTNIVKVFLWQSTSVKFLSCVNAYNSDFNDHLVCISIQAVTALQLK